MVLISIILGLGIAHILMGLGGAIDRMTGRGERGTAKSTAARALAVLLPEIEVVADCRFGCNPHHP